MATFIKLTDVNNRQPVLVNLSLVADIRPLEQGVTLVSYNFFAPSGELVTLEVAEGVLEIEELVGGPIRDGLE